MKRNIFALAGAGLAVASLAIFTSCEENKLEETPTVTLEKVSEDLNSVSFSVSATNASEVAYVQQEDLTSVPSAKGIITAGVKVSASEPQTQIIEHSSHCTGQGVYVLSENQRHLIYENVAEHPACRARNRPHYDVHPYGEAGRYASFHSHDGKKRYSHGIEYEERVVEPHHIFPENQHEYQGKSRYYHIRRLLHPERSDVQQQIPEGPAADCGHESHHVCPESIEILCRSKPYPAYRESESTYIVYDRNKIHGNTIHVFPVPSAMTLTLPRNRSGLQI